MNTSKVYRAGIYIRLSREDEDRVEESESVQTQRDLILTYIKNCNYQFAEEYIDDGFSGTTFDRPAFKRMLEDIEHKKINMVITKDLSRLGRNNGKGSYYMDEYFPLHNVRYIAINDNYDSFGHTNNELVMIKGVFNEWYPLDISNKVRSALKTRKEKGMFTGWKAPYGYLRDPQNKHRLIIDEEASEIVKRIFNMALNGKSCKQIADVLSIEKILNPSCYANLNRGRKSTAYELWCSRTISEMINNETYIGNLTQGRRKKVSYKIKKEIRTEQNDWIIVKDTHEAIIDNDVFIAVQNIMRTNKNNKSNSNSQLLSGLIYCKECGHKIGINKSSDGKRLYCVCNYYRKYSKYNLCTPHTLNYKELESKVLSEIKTIFKQFLDISKLENKLEYDNRRVKAINRLTNQIQKKEYNIYQLNSIIDSSYIDMKKGLIDIERYKSISNKIVNDKLNESLELESLKNELQQMNETKELSKNYKSLIEEYLSLKKADKKLIANIIDKISISEDKNIEINFKFRLN